jgi:WD40 repeat protein
MWQKGEHYIVGFDYRRRVSGIVGGVWNVLCSVAMSQCSYWTLFLIFLFLSFLHSSTNLPLLKEVHRLTSKETFMGGMIPRSMICGGEFAPSKIILGTQGNEIIEYQISDNQLSVVEGRVLMNAHQNILRGLATHPTMSRFVTASEDATVSVWDYESRVLIGKQVELPAPSQTCAISSDGDLIACGLTTGW